MLKARLNRVRWVLGAQYGFDPIITVRGIARTPRFLRDWFAFRKSSVPSIELMPCLQDWNDSSGNARGEYFWQDLYVAKEVFRAQPTRHIDVGSRVDGFVAHVAAFRELDVIDIRPLRSDIPGVRFLRQDMMADDVPSELQADSVSCLHALEHFGLGRYGDPLDVRGHVLGFRNLARMTAPGGRLYLSVPIGRPRVLFNANRIFHPREVLELANENGMILDRLAVIRDGAAPQEEPSILEALEREATKDYALGIFQLRKPSLPR